MTEAPPPLLTINQTAQLLNVHRKTIYRLPIPYVTVGTHRRYRLQDINDYLESRRVRP